MNEQFEKWWEGLPMQGAGNSAGYAAMAWEEATSKAAQKVRYYLKHQNYPAWEKASEFERGVMIACKNVEEIIAPHKPEPPKQ